MNEQKFTTIDEVRQAINCLKSVNENTKAKENYYIEYIGKEKTKKLLNTIYENYKKEIEKLFHIEKMFLKA